MILFAIAVLVISLSGSTIVALLANTETLKSSTYRNLQHNAEYVAEQLDRFDAQVLKQYAESVDIRITLIKADGTVWYDSQYDVSVLDNHAWRSEVVQALSNGSGFSERTSTTQDVPVLYYAAKIDRTDGDAVIRVSRLLSELRAYNRTYTMFLFQGIAIVLLICTGVTIIAIQRLARPLTRITNTAKEISKGNFNERVYVDSPIEFSILANTLNSMAVQLKNQITLLDNERKLYVTILDSMNEGILYVNRQLLVMQANKAAKNLLLGNDASEQMLQGLRLVQIAGAPEILQMCSNTLNDGSPQELEIPLYDHFFGETALVMGRHNVKILKIATTKMNPANEQLMGEGLVMTINDISHLKRLEHVRKDFVANVSHELKTPITAITGFADALLEENKIVDEKTALHFLDIIRRQAVRMQHIVDDLLLLSSLEQQHAALTKTWTSVGQILEGAGEAYRYLADERHARIETIVENPDGLTMYVDGMLIIQALTNLVINAITYSTESSQVTISISVNERHTVISVSDFGCGIPKDAQERIFERFYRVDTARSRRQGGTGLGLSIVKHIVQVHNGLVSVESEVGVGSTFTITLPTDGAEMKRYKTAQTGR